MKAESSLQIRIVTDGDKTTESVAFVRGPQVLATDATTEAPAVISE